MRTTILFTALLAATSVAAPAVAAPKLSGTYTASSDQFCEAKIVGGKVVGSGDLEQFLTVMTVTGGKVTLKGTDQWGTMVTSNKFITKAPVDTTMTLTISGTANPYTVVMGGNTIKANFDRIDAAGIAHRAAFLGLFGNGDVPGTNCTQLIIISRH